MLERRERHPRHQIDRKQGLELRLDVNERATPARVLGSRAERDERLVELLRHGRDGIGEEPERLRDARRACGCELIERRLRARQRSIFGEAERGVHDAPEHHRAERLVLGARSHGAARSRECRRYPRRHRRHRRARREHQQPPHAGARRRLGSGGRLLEREIDRSPAIDDGGIRAHLRVPHAPHEEGRKLPEIPARQPGTFPRRRGGGLLPYRAGLRAISLQDVVDIPTLRHDLAILVDDATRQPEMGGYRVGAESLLRYVRARPKRYRPCELRDHRAVERREL